MSNILAIRTPIDSLFVWLSSEEHDTFSLGVDDVIKDLLSLSDRYFDHGFECR